MSIQLKNIIRKTHKYYKKDDKVGGYTIQEILGEGRYGIAYLALDEDKNKYVVKQLKKGLFQKRSKKWIYEELTLKRLHYSYFPKFIARFQDKEKEGYILEYIEGEVFEDIIYIDRHEFSRDEIYDIASQLLDIVEILHNNNMIHGDIRLPNIIQRKSKELALIDFGLARIIDDYNTEEIDYWYIGDFLIHLYYTSYKKIGRTEKPWFIELDLNQEERVFLKRLMGIEKTYENIHEIRQQLNKIKDKN